MGTYAPEFTVFLYGLLPKLKYRQAILNLSHLYTESTINHENIVFGGIPSNFNPTVISECCFFAGPCATSETSFSIINWSMVGACSHLLCAWKAALALQVSVEVHHDC